MPAQPCMSTTAGNGPAPSGRSSHAATASGLPGVALGNDRFVEAQPVTTIEARSTDSARRSMVRAYTAPQRAAKLEALRRADAYKAGLGRPLGPCATPRSRRNGETNAKGRAAARRALDGHLAAVVLDDGSGNAQPQTKAPAVVGPRDATTIEALEDPWDLVGPGIPADEIPRVFERFYRGRVARANDSGGFGLGLAISRAVVENHGGQMSVESAAGCGATLRIRFPVAS